MLVLAGLGMAAIGFGGKECDSYLYRFEIFMKCKAQKKDFISF